MKTFSPLRNHFKTEFLTVGLEAYFDAWVRFIRHNSETQLLTVYVVSDQAMWKF